MLRLWNELRNGGAVTLARARLWAALLLVAYAVTIAFLLATAHGWNDYQGRPLGSDFSNIYTAGIEANAGHAADIYDPAKHAAAERAIFGAQTPFYGWHYPPFLLLVASLLGHLPYLVALFAWQAVTFALYLGAMHLLIRRTGVAIPPTSWILFAIAFPAVLANLFAGHNGFLTAALLAGALAFLDERPILAGLLFGALAYKPQFGLMIPLALLVTGRWRTIASAAAMVALLCAICTLAFGVDIWSAFRGSEEFTRTVVLEQGNTGFYRIISVFAWVRLWGGSIPLAYALQILVTLLCAASIVRLWRSDAPDEIKGAALCVTGILATPYSLDYDLMALAPAIALLAAHGMKRGFGAWQKWTIASLWLMPLVARAAAKTLLIPVGVPIMILALVWTLAAATSAKHTVLAKA